MLGGAARRQGAYQRAVAFYEEGLRLATALGNQRERSVALLGLRITVYRGGDPTVGRQRLEEPLGEAPFRRAWEGGHGLSLDEAVADALEEAAP